MTASTTHGTAAPTASTSTSAKPLSLLSGKYTTNPEQGAAVMNAFGHELAGQGSMGQAVLDQLRAAGNSAGSDYSEDWLKLAA